MMITKKQIAEALQGSVKKWERIVRSTKGEDNGVGNCPLCALFFRDPGCFKCPIKNCHQTPYKGWHEHHRDEHSLSFLDPTSRTPHCPDCLRWAKEELAFLKSLKV